MDTTYLQQWNGEHYIRQVVYLDSQFDITKPVLFVVDKSYNWDNFKTDYRPNEIFTDAEQAKRLITFEYQTRKIEAIKLVRKLTGWGLKESKDFVDSNC